MSEQLADENHNPGEGLCKLYKLWAKGGAGIVVTGNIMIDREHLGEPKNIVLDKESELGTFRDWVASGTENNTQLWAQLNHPGKQSPKFIQAVPLAPSAIPLEGALQNNFNLPRALEEDDIHHIVSKFWESAALAKSAGFCGVQIHAAHGYLISQFLSPRHNKRKDNWGGSLENRMRFLMEVYRGIRNAVGDDFPIAVKLNSADFMKGGFSESDSMEVARALADAGIDLIEISGGSYEAPAMAEGIKQKSSTQKREAYFLEFAKRLRETVSVPIVVTGGFRSVDAMNQALSRHASDLIGIARPLAVDPDLPNKALADPNFKIQLRPLSTGLKKIDDMILLNMSWYEAQFDRIAKGKAPKPELNEWYAAWKVFLNLGVYAFRKRRA
ncbi:NADH:flavin oxidoreductase/NADH oxidase family protein [Pseudoteredinibacter isoporae]